MIWLALETSCDDTSVAVVEDGRRILSNLISSQINLHRKFGGVVPELASRKHLDNINPLMAQALKEGGIGWDDIGAVAVANGPGLVGSLLVGVAAAKTIAAVKGIPLAGVNHLSAHIYANFLGEPQPELPAVCLLVSGGHTSLALMEAHGRFTLLGETRDDAAGECFDKAARILGLPYPGGPEIDALAKQGNAEAVRFPRPYLGNDSFEFSFSGLKTAVMQYCKKNEGFNIHDVCASFQEAVVDVLLKKTFAAARAAGVGRILLAGGVACNSRLKEKFRAEAEKQGTELHIPAPVLCTDNAAMVACCAYYNSRRGLADDLTLDANPLLSWKDLK